MYKAFIHPKFWPTWIGIGVLYLASRLPLKAQQPLGRITGRVLYSLLSRRRSIVRKNVALCFKELDATAQEALARKIFAENAIGLLEAAYSWWNPPSDVLPHTDFIGFDLIAEALKENKGLLLIGAHFTNLELSAMLIGQILDLDVTYREQNNALMDTLVFNKRQRYFGHVIERNNFRLFLKNLKANHVIWYAPDQDYGAKHSVFADFFGIPAATVKATSKLLEFNHSPALFVSHQRLDNGRYQIKVSPFDETLPSGNEVRDAEIINKKIEEEIRRFPAQYMWTHRRFKSRPNNEPRFY